MAVMAQPVPEFARLLRALVTLVPLLATSPVVANDKPPLSGEMAKIELRQAPAALPALTVRDLDDAPVALDRFKGKVVLLNFWATWCAPCVKEMPGLDRLAARIGPDKLAVVALSLDGPTRPRVKPFIRDKGLASMHILLDTDRAAFKALGVAVLPTTLVIDAGGREIGRLQGDADWDSPAAEALVRHLLAQPAPERR